ncbi:MAG: hypothetical protein AB8G99_22735 [Planctomycetaceae bacterium]
MSARITIQSGIAAGTSHRIERKVARVGSDPQSDICLPTANVPAHALTLEFREEECRVYNRCRDSVYIGARVVGPDEAGSWPETDILQLGEDIELLLDFEDEGSAAYHPMHDVDFDEPDSSTNEALPATADRSNASSSSGAKTVVQLGVTVLCLVGCALLLVRDANRKAPKTAAPNFAAIVTSGLENPKISNELIHRVQHAEQQRIRGQEETARSEFVSIRNDLMSGQPNDANSSAADLDQLTDFVQARLSDLE